MNGSALLVLLIGCAVSTTLAADAKFEEIVEQVLCSNSLVTITMSRDSYIFNQTASQFAVYPAKDTFCPTATPLLIVSAINPENQFNVNGSYCNLGYRSILARDGSTAATYNTMHFYARSFNPFSLQPTGDYYYFDANCLVLQGPSPPASTTSSSPAPTTTPGTTTSTAASTTTSSCDNGGCCNCNCVYSGYKELAHELRDLIQK